MADRKLKSPAASAKSKRAPALERKTLLRVSYQGEPGANSHLACREVFPDLEPVACATFEDALAAVKGGDARYAMIPIENSVAGGWPTFTISCPMPTSHRRRALPARAPPAAWRCRARPCSRSSGRCPHTQALGQCRNTLRKLGLKPIPRPTPAGSARIVAEANNPELAAIATTLAAEIYGLKILMHDIEDEKHNTTRFVVLSATPDDARPATVPSSPPSSSRAQRAGGALQGHGRLSPPTAST
jgi:prephenate dehydratase